MIQVKFEFADNGKSLVLTVQGHADSAEYGKDIVCASASILTYTLAQIVKAIGEEGNLKKKPTIRLEEGNACVSCKPTKGTYDELLHAYTVIQVGFALLAHNYPQYVQLTKFVEG